MRKSAPLAHIFTVSLLSAAAAFFATPYVLAQAEGRIKAQNFPPDTMSAGGYTAAFLCSFLLLSFAARHVKITVKAQGLEKTRGLAPRAARLLLVAAIFGAPLCMLLRAHIPHDKISLKNIMAEAELRAETEKQPGYKKEDRAGLGALIRKEDEHD